MIIKKKFLSILLALPIKSKHRTNEIEQQSEEYSSEYSQTTSQCIPSKRIITFVFNLINIFVFLSLSCISIVSTNNNIII